jgi:hypothetical protein
MIKEDFKKIKAPTWLAIGFLVFIGILSIIPNNVDVEDDYTWNPDDDYGESVESTSHENFGGFFTKSGEDKLSENYEVSYFGCTDDYGMVDMESWGNRDDQIVDGLNALSEDCPDSETYSIKILDSRADCDYFFGGEPIRAWMGLSEENKRRIAVDTRFSNWLSRTQIYYNIEQQSGSSGMTDYQQLLSESYKYYLKNGITDDTLTYYIMGEIDNPHTC